MAGTIRAMADCIETDPQLASLLDDLRVRMVALNELHHPVYAGDPRRIREQERQLDELRLAIRARRQELAVVGTTAER